VAKAGWAMAVSALQASNIDLPDIIVEILLNVANGFKGPTDIANCDKPAFASGLG
jgi:hypothetical protein